MCVTLPGRGYKPKDVASIMIVIAVCYKAVTYKPEGKYREHVTLRVTRLVT